MCLYCYLADISAIWQGWNNASPAPTHLVVATDNVGNVLTAS